MALTPVSIPENEMNQFDLPRICIVTGQTDNIVFKPVKFQWYPPWIGALVLCSPVIFAIVALIMMRRVKGELPFTEEAFSAWQRGKIVTTLSIVGGIALFIASFAAFANNIAPLGLLMMVVSIAGPITAGVMTLKGRGPRVTKLEPGIAHLKFPSAEAATRFASHLTAGARSKLPPTSPAVA